ncbi:polysaccharide deacetylase family protein [Bacillus sp. PS06]|uniref:polysaccharide deacetylase family protein n=1 Tax=Bacillus sp. PS06 TaxID=2764176 RepID=UPI00177AC0A9|nr:polysaccharide deacetylase family protein [Bacillus sp. PS06]MBD8067667.1 polysaccharide deacetylase family protein [Bacillus sp. PS06]
MPKVVMTFPEGKHKVLTMSYDDGVLADRKLVQIFNKYDIKGTFHVNSGLAGTGERIDKEEMKQLYQGHEVSAHTLMHPTIARVPKERIVTEIIEDRKNLEQTVGYTVRGLSYPNGSFNNNLKDTLPYLGIEYARTVHSTGTFNMPDDYLEWNPTCHHKGNLLNLAEDFVNLYKTQYLYMMYVWGHSYEFDLDQNWDLIENFCAYIGKKDDIWYATNIEIVDYTKAFSQLKFAADCSFVYNPTAISIWLNVDDKHIIEIQSGQQVDLNV